MKLDLHIWTQAPKAYTNLRLVEEAKKLDLNCQLSSTLSTPPRPREGSLLLLRSSALDYRDHDIDLALLWQKRGLLHCANFLSWTVQLRDKLASSRLLKKLHLPVPATYPLDDPDLILKLGDEPKNGLVVKPRRSNQGKGLFILDSLKSLRSVARAFHDLGDTQFVVQPRLRKKREWRVLGLPGRPVLWIQRQARVPNEILGNRSYCDESLFDIENEPELQRLEWELQDKLDGLNYWGADVIETHEDELCVLEVNTSPGLQGPEQLTGENLTRELLISLIRTFTDPF